MGIRDQQQCSAPQSTPHPETHGLCVYTCMAVFVRTDVNLDLGNVGMKTLCHTLSAVPLKGLFEG